jgi:hypothetical protein
MTQVYRCTDHKWDNLPHAICTSELEWDPSVLDHDVREDEQCGEVPTPKSFCDEIGDNPVFYDAHETEQSLMPEDNLPGFTPSGPCVLKWWFLGLTCLVLGYILGTFASSIAPELSPHAVPYTVKVRVLTSDSEVIIYQSLLHSTTSDHDNFHVCMSGGESSIDNGILNDRSIIDQSNLAGTLDTAGMSNNGTKVDTLPSLILSSGGESHIHSSLKARSQIDKSKHPAMPTNASMLTDGIEPLPPPEPPPLIFTPEKLIRCIFLMEKQEDSQQLIGQVVISKGSQCNVQTKWENGEITNKPLRVIVDYFVHITQYVYRHKPDVYCDFVRSDISAICEGSTAIDDNVFGIQEVYKILIQQA